MKVERAQTKELKRKKLEDEQDAKNRGDIRRGMEMMGWSC